MLILKVNVILFFLIMGSSSAFEVKTAIKTTWFASSEGGFATGADISGGIILKRNHCIAVQAILAPYGILPVTDAETHTEVSFYEGCIGYSYRFHLLNGFLTISPGILLGISDRPIIYGTWWGIDPSQQHTYAGEKETRHISPTATIQTELELGRKMVKFVLSWQGHYAKPAEYMMNVGAGIVLVR